MLYATTQAGAALVEGIRETIAMDKQQKQQQTQQPT
jgi:hypothetical protein